MSTLGYAILGLLAVQPLSGYDLSKKMKIPVGLFWNARHSQIYTELARLEGQGFIRHEVLEQEDRPDKKLYTITERGLETLRNWVTTPVEPTPIRDELILRAFCLWLANPAQAIALFAGEERRHRELQSRFENELEEGAKQVNRDEPLLQNPKFGSYLTLTWAIKYEREYADWCTWVVEQLKQAQN